MLELTKQEKYIILFLIVTAAVGVGILCYKNLIYTPKVEVISGGPLPTAKEIEDSKVININTAPLADIERLKGIGPSLAESIVEYRRVHSSFKDKEEIRNVKGIGPAKFEAIKRFIKTE